MDTYNVYIDEKLAFKNITEEEVNKHVEMIRQMIFAGIPTHHTQESIKVIRVE